MTIIESDDLLYSADVTYKGTDMQKWIERVDARFVNLTNDEKIVVHQKNTIFTNW